MPPSSLNDKLYQHDFKKKTIYIAHYQIRDIEEYLNRRYISTGKLIKKSHAPLRWLKLFGYHGKDIMKNGWMFSDPNINDAIEYIEMLPKNQYRLRLSCMLPVLIGQRTLILLRKENILDSKNRIKVMRPEIRRIMWQSIALCLLRKNPKKMM